MKSSWRSLTFHREVLEASSHDLVHLAKLLADHHSEGELAVSIWLESLKFARRELDAPQSTHSWVNFIRANDDLRGSDAVSRIIQVAHRRFLEIRAEDQWDAIEQSVADAQDRRRGEQVVIPEDLSEWRKLPYFERRDLFLRLAKTALPYWDEPEAEELTNFLREALFRDMNPKNFRMESGRMVSLKPPKFGDGNFFRLLGDALDHRMESTLAQRLVYGWAEPDFAVSVYPFCFWTDQALIEYAIEMKIVGNEETTSRAVKRHRERHNLVKAPKSYVSGFRINAEGYRTAEYLKSPRKNPAPRGKAQ